MDSITSDTLVYIDTNVWIYYLEANPDFVQKVRDVFVRVEAVGAKLFTNEITIAECLYKPSRDGNSRAVAAYERLFGSGEVTLTSLDGGLAKRAAVSGGQLGLKLIDAIHYIAALEQGCDVFVTSDRQFKSGPAMQVMTILR